MEDNSLPERKRTHTKATQAGSRPQVAILMASFNGEAHIGEQLASFSSQTLLPTELHVSDDGSRDGTLRIVEEWAAANPRTSVTFHTGPKTGFAENFRFLLTQAETEADYLAFSDQDDIWFDGKLETAITKLREIKPGIPAMFCGRTLNFPSSNPNAMSPLFAKAPTFANALVQSIAGGNTIILNRQAFKLVREASKRSGFVSHDWWCYQLITGAGGNVIYCPEPLVKYRQHEGNLVGANNDLSARLYRVRLLLKGRFRNWTDRNLEGLNLCRDLLEPDALKQLDRFAAARSGTFWRRPFLIRKTGVYRQTWQGQIGLYAASLLGLL